MARIHINMPEKFLFSTELQVRVSDLNYGGHVGNDRILTLLQEARVVFYRNLGFASEISFDGPVGQIISDAAVQYKAESFLGDILMIHIGAGDFNKYGFDLFYQVFNKETGKEVARAKTGIVCYNYQMKKVAPVPEVLKSKLNP